MAYNQKHDITPQALKKSLKSVLYREKALQVDPIDDSESLKAAEEEATYMNKKDIKKMMNKTRKNMERAAKELDFMQAAKYRDHLKMLEKQMKESI